MKESACQFGPHRQLAGILTEPEVSTQRRAVVLVSAGVTPKFGPFRLYVELARRLGRAGYRTLRFDLGGIGDSGEAYGGYPLEQRTSLQIKAALDHLSERFQLDGIVLAGLCSGADDSFRHAERDERVSAVVMVDPFAYRTVGFLWRHLLFRAQRRLLRAVGLYRPPPRNRAASLVDYEHLPVAESRRILCELLRRQVQLHFVYTGGMGLKSVNLCDKLLSRYKVAAVPGVAFGYDDGIRLSYCTTLDILNEGLTRFEQFCREH